MTNEQWQRVKTVFQAAVERPPAERPAFLAAAAADDEAVRREVESLLAADAADVSVFDRLPVAGSAATLNKATPFAADDRQFAAGQHLGHYQIVEAIGAGGMGVVYRAKDTTLGRDVALKFLPTFLTSDADRVARFRREAQVLASLNHPRIAQIHGFEQANGAQFLVLELVDGESLDKRIARGPIPIDEALGMAIQIAEALEAAHDKGIVHRDLKPANIAVTRDGQVKVLDFGLAKAVETTGGSTEPTKSPTITSPAMTAVGLILGTAAYMAPEQAKGRPADKRSDIWALGCVLFEMLTRRRAFAGDDVAETLARVLTKEPAWDALPPATAAPVRRLLRRCLEKDRRRRLDSAAAARLDLEDALTSPAPVTTASSARERRRRVSWEASAATVAASLLTALGTWAVMRNEPPAPALPARFTITFPPTEPMELSFRGRDIALSPDGRYLAYQSRGRLMLRALDQLDAVLLPSVTAGRTPFFSPDSRWIGFFDGGDLKKVAVTGEPVVTLSRELGNPQGGTWGDDGTIVVSSRDGNTGLTRVSADGGKATALTKTDGPHQGHGTPSMLPGGRGVLFTIWANAPVDRQIAVLDLKSGQQKTLLRGGVDAEYLDTGHLVYATVGSQGSKVFATLWVVAFDLDRLALRGEPVRVSESLQVDVYSAANYVVSRTGALAYVPARDQARSFVWVDRTGRETAIDALPPRPYGTIGLSPDGTRMAFWSDDRELDIWTWDFARESLARLTFGPGLDGLPRWTPDGRRIVFSSNRSGPLNLFSVASDGSGPVERLTTSNSDQWVNSITPDGTTVLFCEQRPKTGYDILRLPLVAATGGAGRATPSDERPSEPTSLVSSPSEEFAARISPNGRYFAYQSTESGGRFEIYVRRYPDVTKGYWQISTESGKAPVWARSGRELFYLDQSNTLMAVPVETAGPQFSHGRPAKVFDAKYSGDFYSYDVASDGRRFLMMKESTAGDPARPPSMVVVLNWLEELKQRAPAR